jgi:hypothetical protein
MMGKLTLASLHVYPVKSLRGLDVALWPVGARGLRLDRHWMLVDAAGVFLSQRRLPHMALIGTRLDGERLRLAAPGMPDLDVSPEDAAGPTLEVSVWRDRCRARDAGEPAAAWLSRFLGEDCRLVYLPEAERRTVDPAYGLPGDLVGLADGFPFLVISQASLDDLNARLEVPLPMRRFRPNLVIGGTEPYVEDRWRRIRVGALALRLVKPCSRCAITTLDPETARQGAEPLRTLATYRQRGGRVFFGQNAIHEGTGGLAVGDPVEVLEHD